MTKKICTDLALPTKEHPDHSIDIVNEYHQCNRFPWPPDPSTLHGVCLQQQHSNARHQNCAHTNNRVSSAPSSIPPQASPAPSQALLPPSQAPSAPPQVPSVDVPLGPLDGPAMKLHAYPLSFCAVIEQAKLIVQCDATSIDPFMPHSLFIDKKCIEFFNEALTETTNVPQGK